MSSPPQFLRAIWKNDHFIKQAPPLSPCRLFTHLFFNRYSLEKDDISRWLRGPEGQQMRAALWSRSCECAQAVPEAQLLPLAVPKKRIWDPVFRSLGLGPPGPRLHPAKIQEAPASVLGFLSSSGSTAPAQDLTCASRCSGYACAVLLNRTGLSSALST